MSAKCNSYHVWSVSDRLPALGQGMSDVATILARRVAVEFSDSDDCASESEYDSEDWGQYLGSCLPSNFLTHLLQERLMLDRGKPINLTLPHCK